MWEQAFRSEEVTLQMPRCYMHAQARIGVFRTATGLFAIDNSCTHYEAELHLGELKGEVVLCPWHRWRFNLRSGHCDTGPNFDTRVYPVKEEDGLIWIDVAAGKIQARG